jgi:hypothetical protein
MKNYAVIQNDIVTNVVVGDDEWANAQESTLILLTENDIPFIGGKYLDGVFYKTKPFPSWVESNGNWIPPIVKPKNSENGTWTWNELTLSWVSVDLNSSLRSTEEPNDEFID